MENFLLGFSVALTLQNIFFCFLGALIGTLTGVLPGIGPVAAIALLLPVTYYVPVTSVVIMLAGVYYGANYGGSITSILVNIPGESSTAVTCIDGYQMALQGRAGAALGISAFGSFIGGTLAILGLQLIAPPLSRVAVRFGPPEFFVLMIFGLSLVSFLVRGSVLKGLIMATLGVWLGCIGLDPEGGKMRFTFGTLVLQDGIGIVPLVMGIFGISEIILNLEEPFSRQDAVKTKISRVYPSLKDWKDSMKPILRGTGVGFFLGLLPGGGPMLSSFASYAVEKRFARRPEKFGYGAIEGVAGPETANNATAQAGFVPLLTLGLPTGPTMAIMLGGLIIHGVVVGPQLITDHPQLFWGLIVSMYIGNIMLLILNLPLIPLWVQILRVPYKYLFALIVLFCMIGAFSINNNSADIAVMLICGLIGYVLRKIECEPAPLVLAFILGPMLESALNHSLVISNGDLTIFFRRPISLALLAVLVIFSVTSFIRKGRRADGKGRE